MDPRGTRVQLSLELALPAVPVPFRTKASYVSNLLRASMFSLVGLARPTLGLLVVSSLGLALIRDWNPLSEDPAAWHIYVDGSASEEGAGWGLLLLAFLPDGRLAYVGAAAGDLEGSNNAAELEAARQAARLACVLPGKQYATIFYDNRLIDGAINSSFAFESNADIAAEATMLAHVARSRRQLFTKHVASHSGDPWNELVDRIAAPGHAGLPDLTGPGPPVPEGGSQSTAPCITSPCSLGAPRSLRWTATAYPGSASPTHQPYQRKRGFPARHPSRSRCTSLMCPSRSCRPTS